MRVLLETIILIPLVLGTDAIGASLYGIQIDTPSVNPQSNVLDHPDLLVDTLTEWGYFSQAERVARDHGKNLHLRKEKSAYLADRTLYHLPDILSSRWTLPVDGEDRVVVLYCPRPKTVGNAWSVPAFMRQCAASGRRTFRCGNALEVDSQCDPRQGLSMIRIGKSVLIHEELNQGNASEDRYFRLDGDNVSAVRLISSGSAVPFDVISGNTLGTGGAKVDIFPEELRLLISTQEAPLIVDGGSAEKPTIRTRKHTKAEYRWDDHDFILLSSTTQIIPLQ